VKVAIKNVELRTATKLLDKTYTAEGREKPVPRWELPMFGDLLAPSGRERQELHAFRSLIADYARLESPSRPLCLAVFGDPGSGKSYAVESIVGMLSSRTRRVHTGARRGSPAYLAPKPVTINLTQVRDTNVLARTLRSAADASRHHGYILRDPLIFLRKDDV
jgi:hypothetical protein